MKLPMAHKFLILFTLPFITHCFYTPNADHKNIKEYSTEQIIGADKVGCIAMLDHYCEVLFSPQSLGNLKVKSENKPIMVLQGQTANEFTQEFYLYARAKFKRQKLFPTDFKKNLDKRNYFAKLQTLLDRNPRDKMTLEERIEAENLNASLEVDWNNAIGETVLRRMSLDFKNYHKLKDELIPIELLINKRKIKRSLNAQISRAIWDHNANWKKVESGFESIRNSYLELISRLDIPQETKLSWQQKIKSVTLILPGSREEITDEDCSSTQSNAFYYPEYNVITVCAGDFNTEDIAETLAHELGHALDLEHGVYLFQKESRIGQAISKLRENICKPKSFTCQEWTNFKQDFTKNLASLREYNTEVYDFHHCLKRNPNTREIDPEDIDRIADDLTRERISELAESQFLLRVVTERIPFPNGTSYINPNYLNPCSYYLWPPGTEPIDDPLTTLTLYTAEYRCSEGSNPNRIEEAIRTSQKMMKQLMVEVLLSEGEFSSRPQMLSEGLASPSSERFADVMGSYAFALHLEKTTSLADRRNQFLASSSWQCSRPNIEKIYPNETAVIARFSDSFKYNLHSHSEFRRKEYFSPLLMQTLSCIKDFEHSSCDLPFKK